MIEETHIQEAVTRLQELLAEAGPDPSRKPGDRGVHPFCPITFLGLHGLSTSWGRDFLFEFLIS
jgi:hypothetical protein